MLLSVITVHKVTSGCSFPTVRGYLITAGLKITEILSDRLGTSHPRGVPFSDSPLSVFQTPPSQTYRMHERKLEVCIGEHAILL